MPKLKPSKQWLKNESVNFKLQTLHCCSEWLICTKTGFLDLTKGNIDVPFLVDSITANGTDKDDHNDPCRCYLTGPAKLGTFGPRVPVQNLP